MPIMDIHETSTPEEIFFHIQSYIHFPNDKTYRGYFFAKFYLDWQVEMLQIENFTLSQEWLKMLINSPSMESLRKTKAKIFEKGVITSIIASELIEAHDNPSLSQIYKNIRADVIRHKREEGNKTNISLSHYKKIWSEYKSVAHIWLAFIMLVRTFKWEEIFDALVKKPHLLTYLSNWALEILLGINKNKHLADKDFQHFSHKEIWTFPSFLTDKLLSTSERIEACEDVLRILKK